jgi:chromate transporter
VDGFWFLKVRQGMKKGKILLQLFFTMLKIGLFTFGGGYAMIALLENEFVEKKKWLDRDEFLNITAIAESTPGPIAINSATYIGYEVLAQSGASELLSILGSFTATFAVVLPSFIIILLISAIIGNFLKYKGVQAFLSGVRPCIVALILATAITMALSTLFDITTVKGGFSPDLKAIIIFAVLLAIAFVFKKAKKKKPSPILMILISAGLGIIVYSV